MRKLYTLLLFIPFCVEAQLQERHFIIDSLQNELTKSKEDTVRAEILNQLSFVYSDTYPDSGIHYAIRTLKLSGKLGWIKGVANAYADLGINSAAKSDHSQAIYYNQRALALYKYLDNKKSVAATLANLSLVYMARSDYPKALEYDFEALKLLQELHDDPTRAVIQENVGTLYLEEKNYSRTTEYYSKALDTYKKLNDQAGVARNLGNKGIVEDATGNYKEALTYHLQSLAINQKLGKPFSIQINLANIGIVYSHLNLYDKALQYQFKALKISEDLKSKSSTATNLGNIGETYFFMAKNQPTSIHATSESKKSACDQAIYYLERAANLCTEIGYIAPLIEFEKYLSEVYQLAGDYEKALTTFKRQSTLNDSLFSKQNRQKQVDLEKERELSLKERDIIIKNKEVAMAQMEAHNKRTERNLTLITLILLVIVMLMGLRKFLRRIRVQKSALNDIAGIHAHDIRGPVARIIGLTELFDHNDINDPDNKKLIRAVRDVSLELDEIVKKIVNKTSV